MSGCCSEGQDFCFANLSLYSVLSEWLKENLHISHCTTTLLTQLGLFLLAWYAVRFALKIFLTLTYPVMALLCGYMAIQMLSVAGSELPATLQFYLDELVHWMTSVGLRMLSYICRTVDAGPLLYPSPY